MTTIAWRDGILAADTRLTVDGTPMKCSKIKMLPTNIVISCSGNAEDEIIAHEYFSKNWRELQPPKIKKSFECIIIIDGYPYFCERGLKPIPIEHEYYATGSGWKYAVAAMEMGFTAKQAVQFASRLDVHTNNEVDTFDAKAYYQKKVRKSKSSR